MQENNSQENNPQEDNQFFVSPVSEESNLLPAFLESVVHEVEDGVHSIANSVSKVAHNIYDDVSKAEHILVDQAKGASKEVGGVIAEFYHQAFDHRD